MTQKEIEKEVKKSRRRRRTFNVILLADVAFLTWALTNPKQYGKVCGKVGQKTSEYINEFMEGAEETLTN